MFKITLGLKPGTGKINQSIPHLIFSRVLKVQIWAASTVSKILWRKGKNKTKRKSTKPLPPSPVLSGSNPIPYGLTTSSGAVLTDLTPSPISPSSTTCPTWASLHGQAYLPWHIVPHYPAGSHSWGPQSGNLPHGQVAGLPSPLYPQYLAVSLRNAH